MQEAGQDVAGLPTGRMFHVTEFRAACRCFTDISGSLTVKLELHLAGTGPRVSQKILIMTNNYKSENRTSVEGSLGTKRLSLN